jgi:hypothetical protein
MTIFFADLTIMILSSVFQLCYFYPLLENEATACSSLSLSRLFALPTVFELQGSSNLL